MEQDHTSRPPVEQADEENGMNDQQNLSGSGWCAVKAQASGGARRSECPRVVRGVMEGPES